MPRAQEFAYDLDDEPRLGADGAVCRAILDALPEWFGMAEANDAYQRDIPDLETLCAYDADGRILGFVSFKHHFPETAEVWVMAVRREHHRWGVGRALLARGEAWLAARGVTHLQVKTLGPSREYTPYERTRAFYRAVGFTPVEEFPLLWDADNPCLLMVKALASPE